MREYRRRHIRSLAERLLELHNACERPVDVERIARELGITIARSTADDDMSGFIYRSARGDTVIGVNESHHLHRQRFTIAHEIGHFLMHVRSGVHVDSTKNAPLVLLRDETSSEGTEVEEVEANAFASELLLPASLFIEDMQQCGPFDLTDDDAVDRAFKELSRRYKVSKQAIAFRVARLGYTHL